MSRTSLHDRIVGPEAPWWAVPARFVLRLGEFLCLAGVSLRNRGFDRGRGVIEVGVPVISVGNLTVGGTGKTPMVIALVRRLTAMGFNPAVVARGYKAGAGEANDEERLIRARCPEVAYVANPDRVAGAERACGRFGADVVVLDDGFQHRRLARALDIVLVDATCPFGYEHLLPRGLLREPLASLRRANLVAVTRCDQVSAATKQQVTRRIRSVAGGAAVVQCVHRVSGLRRLDGVERAGSLEGVRVALFAGLARPEAFATTVRALGAEVVGQRWWPDHHRYRVADVDSLLKSGTFPPYDLLLTTEKDAVKLEALLGIDQSRIHVVRVEIDFLGDGGTMLQTVLDQTLNSGQST